MKQLRIKNYFKLRTKMQGLVENRFINSSRFYFKRFDCVEKT